MTRRTILPVVLSVVVLGMGSLGALEARETQNVLVRAQGSEPPAEAVTRVFQLQNARPTALAETLGLFRADIRANNELHTLSIMASPVIMAAIEEVIARLDVPQNNPALGVSPRERAVELTMHILSANNANTTQPVPESLRSVVDQLRKVFSYRSFVVLDTVVLRALNGRDATTSGTIATPPFGNLLADTPATFYNFRGKFFITPADKEPARLEIRGMAAGFRVPVPSSSGGSPAAGQDAATPRVVSFQYVDVGINTDVEIPAGQQVVVGKTTIGESAIIIVMSATFLD